MLNVMTDQPAIAIPTLAIAGTVANLFGMALTRAVYIAVTDVIAEIRSLVSSTRS